MSYLEGGFEEVLTANIVFVTGKLIFHQNISEFFHHSIILAVCSVIEVGLAAELSRGVVLGNIQILEAVGGLGAGCCVLLGGTRLHSFSS